MQNWLARLVPFLAIGVAIVIFAFGLFILSYLLMVGALVGFVLFTIAWVRNRFFGPRRPSTPVKREGRTIDHDDL